MIHCIFKGKREKKSEEINIRQSINKPEPQAPPEEPIQVVPEVIKPVELQTPKPGV